MDLLIAANTVTQAQADTAPTTGTPGWATDGNPATGLLATDAPAWHYNMMMSELISIIKAAGITPSNADWSQVLKAMQTIFSPAQYGVAPFSASLAQLIGGYPLGAIVFDAAGNYWRSTKANNLTVPSAENANWVNFFAGVMTQQQADLRYLLLAGGNVTGAMDWGDKAAAGTITHRFWAAGAPAEGDATPDATLTATGGTPGTANAGTLALETGTLDLSSVKSTLLPDATLPQQPVVFGQLAGLTQGRLLNTQTFRAGTFTYTPTPGTKRIEVWLQAGGGAGGAAQANNTSAGDVSCGGSGGGGTFAFCQYELSDILAQITAGLTITVGAGGVATTAITNGTNGAASSFGNLATCPGGKGGTIGSTQTGVDYMGGLIKQSDPATGTGIVFQVAGGAPGAIMVNKPFIFAFPGGDSFFGPGTPMSTSFNIGHTDAVNPGTGGSGVGGYSGVTNIGGSGADGIAIIREYA